MIVQPVLQYITTACSLITHSPNCGGTTLHWYNIADGCLQLCGTVINILMSHLFYDWTGDVLLNKQTTAGTSAVSLTVEQHMKTITKEPKTPPIPTIQVIRRKRITPKIFWMHGKYTPIKVPSCGAWNNTKKLHIKPEKDWNWGCTLSICFLNSRNEAQLLQ